MLRESEEKATCEELEGLEDGDIAWLSEVVSETLKLTEAVRVGVADKESVEDEDNDEVSLTEVDELVILIVILFEVVSLFVTDEEGV